MTDTARTIAPDSDAWPRLAPQWATHAEVSESGTLTFVRGWNMPSLYRDAAPLLVVRVEEEWTRVGPAEYVVNPVRVAAGEDALWADWLAEDVATALEEIVAALRSGQTSAPAAEQEGEDG